MKIYLVGGAVRDILLGREARDRDYVVVGSTAEEMLALGYEQVGADFPVFISKEGEEYALARCEKKTGPGYNGFDTRFTPDVTLEEDLFRRDLTINSMAMDRDGNVIDPYGGKKDLENKILRHTSDAFSEDPVRVLRIARFAARYTDFNVHEVTMQLMQFIVESGEFDALTAERVWAEFKKGLMEAKPSRMYQVLAQCGALKKLAEFGIDREDVLNALDMAANVGEVLPVRFGIVSGGFTNNEAFQKWTIPSDCSDVAKLVAESLQQFTRYDDMEPNVRLSVLMALDLIRRPDRFDLIMWAIKYLANSAEAGTISLKICKLQDDIAAIKMVDAGKIAATVQPKEIKQAVFNARVQSMKGE